MKKFAFIVREDITKTKTEEELRSTIRLHTDWARALMEKDLLDDGWGLTEKGCLLERSGENIQQVAIPNPEIAFGGIYVVKANSYEEAIELAKECPTYELGDKIEVRELLQ
jgi:hypothetical protein